MDNPQFYCDDDLEVVIAELLDYANAGQAVSRSACGRAAMELAREPLSNEDVGRLVAKYWASYVRSRGGEPDSFAMAITLSQTQGVLKTLADIGIVLSLRDQP